MGLAKEAPELSQFQIETDLALLNFKYSLENHLDLRGEMLAACIIGWILSPLVGGMIINTGIGIAFGGISYTCREYYRTHLAYKLYFWLFEQKVETLLEEEIITEEEQEVILSIVRDENNPGKTFKEPLAQFFYKLVYTLSRAFPVVTTVTEEEIYQRKYLSQIEPEYDEWRKERGLPSAGTYYPPLP